MEMRLIHSQELRQEMRLVQMIELTNLMAVPDEVITTVAGAVSYNPDIVESALKKQREDSSKISDAGKRVQTVYSSLIPSKGDSELSTRSGLIGAPDIRVLADSLGQQQTVVTQDVKYIGRRKEKPELVFSDHLNGAMRLNMCQIDSSKYPETSKLLAQLAKFDEWKRRTLRDAYVIIGGTQREFLEDFDNTKYHLFTQAELARKLELSPTTISRILARRWVESRNVEGERKFMYAKDFFADRDDLIRFNSIPVLNEILKREFERKAAYSDGEIASETSRTSRGISRRTVVKYRANSEIPSATERDALYGSDVVTEPFRFK